MTPHHIDADRLAAFVSGTLREPDAVEVALHLDDCPACANRAVGLEPLAAAFASVDDPRVPRELAAEVLHRAAQEPARPTLPVELVVGSLLIAAATTLAWLGGQPASSALQFARFGRVARSLADLSGASVPIAVLVPLAVVVGFAAVVALGRADEDDAPGAQWGLR